MRNFVPVPLLGLLVLAACNPVGGIGQFGGDAAAPDPGETLTEDGTVIDGAAGAPLSALGEEATAPPPSGGESGGYVSLGRDQATLGDATDPGLWMTTRHVTAPVQGKVVAARTGREVVLELRPSGGAGARLSLLAMQQLGVTLTSIPEVEVFGPAPPVAESESGAQAPASIPATPGAVSVTPLSQP